jgi:methyl-accepting chemotaxis protein
MDEKKKPDTGFHIEQTDIYRQVIENSSRRLFIAFISIMTLANIATIAIKATGAASQYLTYAAIAVECVLATAILLIAYLLTRRFRGRRRSGYIAITGILIALWMFQYVIYGASELFAAHYIALALSVFYFDVGVSIYTFVLVIASQTLLFVLRPELVPSGPTSNIIVRYLIYIWVGIGAASGAGATKKLLAMAIESRLEAFSNLQNLKEIAGGVISSIAVLKGQAEDQDAVTRDLNDIAQHQAASLEEISSSLEELTSNSESISSISRSVYEELSITVDSVNDLKMVNDKAQISSQEIKESLADVNRYSDDSSRQIGQTREMIQTLSAKSAEMSNFISVINDIADMVNLLSLNAAIEAARAGDYGKGFAVVADEISKLADATTQNSKEIEKIIKVNQALIGDSHKLITQSSEYMGHLGGAIAAIGSKLTDVTNLIGDIDMTIKTIRNLNTKVYDTSKIIENSTTEQRIATNESSNTTYDVARKAQQIVEISMKISASSKIIHDLTDELEALTRGMTS